MTADEVAAMEKGEAPKENSSTPSTKKSDATSSGTKRKAAEMGNDTPVKKSKIASESADSDEDEDAEEDLG